MNSIVTRGSALLAALVVASACSSSDGGGGPTGPVPGPVRVLLTSPNTDDGAIMFQVTGVVDSVAAPAGLTLYQSSPGPNVIRAIVTGNVATGSNLLTLYVADVGNTSGITTQMLQVAARVTYTQRPVGSYSLQVQK